VIDELADGVPNRLLVQKRESGGPQRHSGFQRVFRMVPGRIAMSQAEHEGIMVALRDHDAESG
jgi:hypothetical protein